MSSLTISKRCLIAFIVSFLLSLIAGKLVIPLLKKMKAGQNILCYLKEHFCKSGTPTMGGLFFLPGAVIVFFCLSLKDKSVATLSSVVALSYMTVGFLDDFIKIRFCRNEGLTPLQKILFQLAVAVISTIFAYRFSLTKVYVPFTDQLIDLGAWFFPLSIFAFVATTNCVNLTDGLDGLAGTVSKYALLGAVVLIFVQTTFFDVHVVKNEYYNLALFSVAVIGATDGFLIYNTNRASVFMGDTGSLSLGGLFASVMIFSGNALYIPIIGIMFVVSGISVIVQVISYKLTKRRVFLMSPLHHHFQHKGASESKIVFAYGAVTLMAVAISLINYL